MNDYYYIVVTGRPPSKSNSYGARAIGKRAIIYTTRELEDYELMVGKAVEEVIPETLRGYHALYVRIYQKGARFIDIDNVFKGLQDSIDTGKTIKRGKNEIQICSTGIEDDKFFQLIIGERIIVENSSEEEERVEIIVAPYEGLFNFVDVIKEHYELDRDYYKDLFYPYKEKEKE